MGWRERFQQGTFGINPTFGNASFRGVPFFIDSHKNSTGKRLVEHEYPQSRNSKIEELGPTIRRYILTASIIGDDHMDQRDSLLAVCDANGTGILQHPYYGKITVQCKTCDVEESSAELRVTRLQLEFVEVSTDELIKVAPNTTVALMDAVSAAYLALDETFREAYAVAGIPYNEALQVQRVLNLGFLAIDDAKKVVGRVAEYFKLAQSMVGQVGQIFAEAGALIEGIVDMSSFGITDEGLLPADFVLNRRQELKDVKRMWDFSPLTTAPSATVIPSVASNVLVQSVQVAGVITAAGISATMEFSSVEEASSVLTAILEKIDALALATTPELPDSLFISLQDLRATLSQDIDAKSRTLSRIVTYNTNTPLPAIVISNILYGNVNGEADLLSRNQIGHPGFVGGAPLQVLIDAS
jgi:prophage DNA circulation protein